MCQTKASYADGQLSRKKVYWKHAKHTALRPSSDAVFNMSRIEFNELSSCEVWRLNQFRTADVIRIGSAIFPAWLSRE